MTYSTTGLNCVGADPALYNLQNPTFIQGLDQMTTSTPTERITYLESYLNTPMNIDERAALYYLILKEKCCLFNPGDLRTDMDRLMQLPYSQTVNGYKELGTFCFQNFQLCQPENGLNQAQGQRLLNRISEAESRYLDRPSILSVERYLHETECLKTLIKTWVACPLLHLARKNVDESLLGIAERVNGIFFNVHIDPQSEIHTLFITSLQEFSSLDGEIVKIWNSVPHDATTNLKVSIVVELITPSGSWHYPFEHLIQST